MIRKRSFSEPEPNKRPRWCSGPHKRERPGGACAPDPKRRRTQESAQQAVARLRHEAVALRAMLQQAAAALQSQSAEIALLRRMQTQAQTMRDYRQMARG